jgi:adenosylmethionine-8-amino-7-oxononanoate aminotransferase
MTPAQRAELVALDKRYLWHPYTPMQQYIEHGAPLVIERASGSRLYDADGRSFLDGNASWWTSLLGHNYPRLVRALTEQAQRLCHTALAGMTHEPAVRLAQELAEIAPPGLEHVFFSDDGSTAVELALKMALQYWQQNGEPERRRFVALDGAFHGETLGVTALSGVEVFRRPFAGVVMECVHVPATDEGQVRACEVLFELLRREGSSIAAVVVEPMIQGAGGMRLYPAQFLRDLRAATKRHRVILVADEVFTGYGRSGPMWACDHAGVSPDILCSAKGFSGGLLPMAVTLSNEEIFRGFLGAPERALYYGHTFCGNPLGAAVAREVLAIYRDEGILAAAQAKAQQIEATFRRLGQLPGVTGARSLGMVGALEIGAAGGYLERGGWRVYEAALARGAYLRPLGNTVYVAPALNIPDADLAELLEVLTLSVTEVVEQRQS